MFTSASEVTKSSRSQLVMDSVREKPENSTRRERGDSGGGRKKEPPDRPHHSEVTLRTAPICNTRFVIEQAELMETDIAGVTDLEETGEKDDGTAAITATTPTTVTSSVSSDDHITTVRREISCYVLMFPCCL